jgi:hypothetical protein
MPVVNYWHVAEAKGGVVEGSQVWIGNEAEFKSEAVANTLRTLC